MKVALVLYGFFRTFEFCSDSLKKFVLDPLNPDIYITSADTVFAPPEHEISELHPFYARSKGKTSKLLQPFLDYNVKSINLKTYDSNIFKMTASINNMEEITSIGQRSWRIISTISSICGAIKNFTSNPSYKDYDLVIVTRPDVRYYRPFDTSAVQLDKINYPAAHMCEPTNPSMLHLPEEERKLIEPRIRKGGAGIFGYPGQWFNDQIICGNPNNIKELGNLEFHIDEYYKEGIYLNTETYLGVHCMKNAIPFVGTDFTTYELWRIDQPEY